jgi:hypothetical protein
MTKQEIKSREIIYLNRNGQQFSEEWDDCQVEWALNDLATRNCTILCIRDVAPVARA